MPRIPIPLTDTKIRALKPKSKRYIKADGGGLVIEVMTSGAKIWRYRYSLHGRQQPLVTIGDYPAVDLDAARDRARKYTKLVRSGIDPAGQARRDRGAEATAESVKAFAEFWFKEEIANKSESYRVNTRRALDKDILPAIGRKPLDQVTPADVLKISDAVKGRGSPKAALFTRNVLKRMFDFAISRHEATGNPAQQVVARFIAKQESRTRVLQPDEIGHLLREIYVSDMARAYKLALHLLVITMVRKSELIEAQWSEVDFVERIWRIPADRMKEEREHWVFLSTQAFEMFKELKTLSHSERYIFPSRRGRVDKPIAKSTLNQAVRAMRMEIQHFVLHDFRRTSSTHLNEMGYSSDAIEKALAHEVEGVRGIYNRAQYAQQRREILQLWADFVDGRIQADSRTVIS